jgi:hypothetical protein
MSNIETLKKEYEGLDKIKDPAQAIGVFSVLARLLARDCIARGISYNQAKHDFEYVGFDQWVIANFLDYSNEGLKFGRAFRYVS